MVFFWRFRAATKVYIIHKVQPRNYHYVHFCMTVIKVLYYIPNSRESNSNSNRNFCCTISLYCELNKLLFGTFLMHSIWRNSLHTLLRNLWYFVRWCCHLGNRLVIGPIFTRESSYCFHRVLAIAILSVRLSVCLSVCPSHGWISQKRCKLGLPNFYRQLHGDPDREFGILYINLAWTPQFYFQLIYWTGTAVLFRASREH